MIENFVALSANERTYLAWIRTSIAIMGFGILIDKLDAAQANAYEQAVSTALIVLGVCVLGFSGLRFLSLNYRINSGKRESAFQWRFYVVFSLINLSLLLLVLAFFMRVI